MRVLIIGGTRFIGPRVVNALIHDAHDVTVIHRGLTNTDIQPQVRSIIADRRTLPSMREELQRLKVNVVVDMCCMTEEDARGVVSAFKGIADRLVVLSSMDVYWNYGAFIGIESGDPLTGALTEQSALRSKLYPYRANSQSPDDLFYNYEKILVEQTVSAVPELPATILRLPAVYGPGDHRLFDHLKRMIDGRNRIILGESASDWRWTRGYVENVADAIAVVTTTRPKEIVYNIGELDALTEKEWAEAIGRAAGWNGEVVVASDNALPEHLRMPYNFAHHLWADTSMFRNEFSFEERFTRTEGLMRTLEWERSHQPDSDPARFNYEAEDDFLKHL